MVRVIIGLGSSLGDSKKILDLAYKDMKSLGKDFKVSTYIETEPWGGVAKNKFINAVCVFETKLGAIKLLDKLQEIENKYGRIRDLRWGDRTLDLDILYYGDELINNFRLTVPHPRIKERDFVMKPLLELLPNFKF